MKLEIKHIAPYLPYGLKIELKKNTYPKTTEIVDLEFEHLKYLVKSLNHTIKPLLRPLSYIDAELIDKKEGFKFRLKDCFCNGLDIECNELIKKIKTNTLYTPWTFVLRSSYLLVQNLLEHHFDIYGLIEKGLAIDMCSIEQKSNP